MLSAFLKCLDHLRRSRSVAERHGDVAQPAFMADAPNRAAAGFFQKFRFAPGKQLRELPVIEAVPHGEVPLGGGTGEFIPRARELAVIAAVDAIADRAAKLQGYGAVELDGEVGNAAPRVETIGRNDGAGVAGGHAGAACSAVRGTGRLLRQFEAQVDLSQN